MLAFVAALVLSTVASGIWCAAQSIRASSSPTTRAGAIAVGVVLVAAAGGVAVALRVFFVPPHLAMYLDEPWYAEAACNLSRLGRLVLCREEFSATACVPYEKAVGWPVVISVWTRLVGCDTAAGIALNRVFGSVTVIMVALAARCAGAKWWQAAMPAALLALHPVHVSWSATGETNVPAAAALAAGLCGALVFLRSGRPSGAALAASALGLSTAIRPESFAAALAAAAIVALLARATVGRRAAAAAAIAGSCGAAAATALPLWSMNESISGGMFLSWENVLTNGLDIVRGGGGAVHGVVVLLACTGAVALARARDERAVWLLGGTAFAAAAVALAYDRFHERMLLGATVCLLPLSAFAVAGIAAAGRRRLALVSWVALGVSGLALAGGWEPLLRATARPPETQVLETRVASRVARLPLPADALVIAEQPTVLAAGGMTHVMSTADALRDPDELVRRVDPGRPVYFFRDMFCESGFQASTVPSLCDRMGDRFALTPVLEASLYSRTYGLYRVGRRPAAGGPR